MTPEEFQRRVPFLKPLEVDEDSVLTMLMRVGGNLEALQGFKSNPEIASRINENLVKLLQSAGQMILGLQLKACESGSEKEQIKTLQAQVQRANQIISVLTDEKSSLQDELELLK